MVGTWHIAEVSKDLNQTDQFREGNVKSIREYFGLNHKKGLDHHSKSCIKASFERLAIFTNDRNNSTMPARRSLRRRSKEGQSNKKCSASSCHHLLDAQGLGIPEIMLLELTLAFIHNTGRFD